MSAIGFDSCFYERLNHYSKSLNRILLASEGKLTEARDEDWLHTLQLVKSLSVDADDSLVLFRCSLPSGPSAIFDELGRHFVRSGTAKS